jgi:organic radical activating enzyme
MNKKIDCHFPYYDIFLNVPNDSVTWCCKLVENSKLTDLDPDALHDTPLLKSIRTSLNEGIQHSACKTCWDAEKNNIQSWRQAEGSLPEELANKDLTQPPYNNQFRRIEIFFDTTCDLACVYCDPSFSSNWAQENNQTKIHPEFLNKIYVDDQVKIQKIKDTIRSVSKTVTKDERVDIVILGGEPFLSPRVKNGKFIEYINIYYENAPIDSKLQITFITNCNTPDQVFDKNLAILRETKAMYPNLSVHITMSLECVGKLTEITRYGSDWNQVDKNINKWLQEDWIFFNFNTVFNAMTIHAVDEYIKYLVNLYEKHQRQIIISPNICYSPEGLQVSIMPTSYANYIDNAIQTVSDNKHCFAQDDHGYEQLLITLTNIKTSLGKSTDKINDLKTLMEYSNKYRQVDFKKHIPSLYNYVYNITEDLS